VAEASPDDVVATLYRLALGIPPGSTLSQAQPAIDTIEEASRTIRGCEALAARAEELGTGNLLNAGRGPVGQLPPAIRAEVAGLPDGVPTRAIRLPDGVVVFMLCDRDQSNTGMPSREAITESLTREKLSLMRRRYLRDLRNAAYIEVRV
jgi:peptidyl-prolyl cis-trans isomerase SurA